MAKSDNISSKDPTNLCKNNLKNHHLTRLNDAYTIVQELSNRSQLTKFSGSQKSIKTNVGNSSILKNYQFPLIHCTNSAENCQQFCLSTLQNKQSSNLNPSENSREYILYLKNPTLKNEEVEIEKRDLRLISCSQEVIIFVGSWNMNGQLATKDIKDIVFPFHLEYVPDIVAIGTQETCENIFEWEATIQAQLGPTKVLFHSVSLGTLHLAVFIRRDLIWHCSEPEDSSISVRAGSAFRTKGAVAISFCLFGTSFLFVTSHLTAHQQNVSERIRDVKRITNFLGLPKNLNLRKKSRDVTDNFDNVYWCGDLNFRLNETRKNIFEWIRNTKFPLSMESNHEIIQTDQLLDVLAAGDAFKGFNEAKITFPPTYKYDPGTNDFDSSYKERAPAYTDRILYKYRQHQGLRAKNDNMLNATIKNDHHFITCLIYDSVPSIKSSDHKPVYAVFKTTIRPGKDSASLAGGRFNRQIYLEGMKRRLSSETLRVCCVQ